MLAYRETGRPVPLRQAMRAIRHTCALVPSGHAGHDECVAILIEFGTLEAGIADHCCPQSDGLDPLITCAGIVSEAAADWLQASWTGTPTGPNRDRVQSAIERMLALPLPATVRISPPEGFAHYGLYPETYGMAAQAFAAAHSPRKAVCIGLRSIGTTLSAMVAAALKVAGIETARCTLRPRGHPFDRRPVVDSEMQAWLAAHEDAWFCVVDEGPGLSGSSFIGTATFLEGLGIPRSRIVLFPSHRADPETLMSATARNTWDCYIQYHANFETSWLSTSFLAQSRDLGAGNWRALRYGDQSPWPAVHPHQERRKYLAAATSREPVLHKFVGLGRHGQRAIDRAQQVALAGFGLAPAGFRAGFAATLWHDARSPQAARGWDQDLRLHLPRVGDYLAWRSRAFRTADAADDVALVEMALYNVRALLGDPALSGLQGLEAHVARFGQRPTTAIDGRMAPHEWLLVGGQPLKTDNAEHADDHILPGPADPAWDVAGTIVEWALTRSVTAAFIARQADATEDPALARRLPFYTVAYLALRAGADRQACHALRGSAEARRLARRGAGYRRGLAASLPALRAQLA